MGRVLGTQLWGLARYHLNKVTKAEGLVWVMDLRLVHLHAKAGCDIHVGRHMGHCNNPDLRSSQQLILQFRQMGSGIP